MALLVAIADRIVRLLALIGALGVVAMMLHVSADVALRAVTGAPLPATIEVVSRYHMVLVAFLPLAWVERRRGMVSVELTDWALGPRLTRASDILVALFAAAVYGVMTWTTWATALSEWRSGTFVIALTMPVAVWPSYFLPPAGFALAAAATLVRAVALALGRMA